MNMNIHIAIAALFGLLLGSAPLAQAQQTIFDELYSSEMLEITIETDLTNLIDNRKEDEYQRGTFTFDNHSGEAETHDIKLKARGKFRRKVCDFPPIKLNFSKGRLLERGYLAEYDKLKLVTHCLDDNFASKENVAKEYLAYKLYSELTDKSYRAQLVKITYIDSKKKISRIKSYGFILEDVDEMAHRVGGNKCDECINLPANQLSAKDENIMAVFQYMIGNADYSLSMARNLKFVQPYTGGGVIPVPYDFDFAGLVAPSYAIPNADYGLVSVKQRVFLGNRTDSAMLSATLQLFVSRRSAMEDLVDDLKLLSRQGRGEVRRYLDSFYEEADAVLRGSPQLQPLRQQALRGVADPLDAAFGK